ncbi:MAG: FAD-dependent oxidoreductase [Planctomycetes bacterium]|nr:FAD-dependent oxidoreductase [Planctomycetota bacterium]
MNAPTARRRIAVVGAGVAGLVAARVLHARHEVTVFEAAGRLGGHTHTVDVDAAGGPVAVDTGFIVYNERNYPLFTRLLARLRVVTRASTMSFSVRCERTGLEYCGSSPRTLFAQPRNLLRPAFWGMLRDIVKFHRLAPAAAVDGIALADLLAIGRFGRAFVDHYLVPMAAAIWSAEPESLRSMPARFLVDFLANHGMLQIRGRPAWRTIVGGSRNYVEPLVRPLLARIRLNTPVIAVRRTDAGVVVETNTRQEAFDDVVLACHADQALTMLADADPDERAALAAVRFQPNDVVLHTDGTLLPRRAAARAAWNYHVPAMPVPRATVTYDMNVLQGLRTTERYCVTLNRTAAIAPARVLRQLRYEHPTFDGAAVRAQAALTRLQGRRRTWFCGAWCGNGFHEAGVVSALAVTTAFGLGLDDLESS